MKLSGGVTYNGHNMDEFVPERTAAYISQHDVHIGEMTVSETLAFSARCQGVGSRYGTYDSFSFFLFCFPFNYNTLLLVNAELLAELIRREKAAGIKPDPDIDVFMKVRGAEDCLKIKM